MMRPRPDRHGGFILAAVLWILAALAAFVSVFTLYVSASTKAMILRDEGIVASSLATAATELAAQRLLAGPKSQRPTHGDLSFRMGSARVSAVFRDEAARIDLNAAPREVLAGLFGALGAQPEAAATYADRILAFRTPPTDENRQEEDLYREAGLDYGPRGASFAHLEEVWRVAGLPPALVAAAVPHLTVYSGRSTLNVGEADAVVRAALAGSRGETDALDPGPQALPGTTTAAGDTARVTVRIDFGDGHRRMAEAVILLREFGDTPYQVLDWREEAMPAEPAPRGGRDTPERSP